MLKQSHRRKDSNRGGGGEKVSAWLRVVSLLFSGKSLGEYWGLETEKPFILPVFVFFIFFYFYFLLLYAGYMRVYAGWFWNCDTIGKKLVVQKNRSWEMEQNGQMIKDKD